MKMRNCSAHHFSCHCPTTSTDRPWSPIDSPSTLIVPADPSGSWQSLLWLALGLRIKGQHHEAGCFRILKGCILDVNLAPLWLFHLLSSLQTEPQPITEPFGGAHAQFSWHCPCIRSTCSAHFVLFGQFSDICSGLLFWVLI